MAAKEALTPQEVAKHNTKGDCWLIIAGKVYDVTKLWNQHPGGNDLLLSSAGKDVTNDFEDVGHSTIALAMRDKYYIGDVDKTPEFIIKILQFLVPLVILGLAVAVRVYTKS